MIHYKITIFNVPDDIVKEFDTDIEIRKGDIIWIDFAGERKACEINISPEIYIDLKGNKNHCVMLSAVFY